MTTIERIRRLNKNYALVTMHPRPGNLHACLNVLDYAAGIKTSGKTGAMLFTGCAEHDTPVGARVREHERHAGMVEPKDGAHYFWLGALAEMG
jgi:hypothetical protein